MSAAFLSLIWVRVFLITLQLAYLLFFCGRMILIKWRLLETSPPLTKWTKSRGWCTDEQTTTGSACQDCHLLLVSSQQELVLEDDVWASCRPNTKLFVHTGGTRRKAGASWESVPPPHGPPSCLSSSISSHPPRHTLTTFFLHPWCSIFCWEAFFCSGRGNGIVLKDQWKFHFQNGLVYCAVL